MASFMSLPGELTAIIRQNIPCHDLSTHLALYIVSRGARLALYDEDVWRDLCYANGLGGIFSRGVVECWRKSALIFARYHEWMGESHCRRYGPLQWAVASKPTAAPSLHYMRPLLELHPAFASLSFDRRALVLGHGLGAAYVHTQPWDGIDHRARTIADQIADVTPTQLEHHVGAYSLAAVPAVSELSIVFDHWGASLDESTAKEACSFTSELARVHRQDGVRVIDVVEGILKWLMTPLSGNQVDKLVELDRLLDPELYAMLEFSTDPDTLAAYWKRKYQRRGDVFKANFAGLRIVEDAPNTVRVVWCPEIRFTTLGHDGIVNAKEIGDLAVDDGWLVNQINRIVALDLV